MKDIKLTEEHSYQVVDNMERSLKSLRDKKVIEFAGISPRGLALQMFVELMNVVNPPAKKVTKIEVKYETSN